MDFISTISRIFLSSHANYASVTFFVPILKFTDINRPRDWVIVGARMSPFWILLELRIKEVVVTTGAIRAKDKGGGGNNWSYKS